MTKTLSTGAVALVLAAGCGITAEQQDASDPSIHDGDETGSGVGSGETPSPEETPPAPSCLAATPTGTIAFANAEWGTELERHVDVAVTADDHVVLANGGTTKFTSAGVYEWGTAFGDLVATDPLGNIYAAGLFDRAIDFGNGVVEPHGYDGHAYLAKLDGDGTLVALADELGLCGVQSVTALAVDRDGRVAISGAGLGTIVLDAQGAIVLTLSTVAYDVAFDHYGNLVLVGEANGDGFIAKVDRAGTELFRETVGDSTGEPNTPQRVNAVTIDAGDNILALGWLETEANVFGRIVLSGSSGENGDYDVGFLVKLTNDGTALWSTVHGGMAIGGVAVDPLGNVLVSTSSLGSLYPYEIPTVEKLSTDGAMLWFHSGEPGAGYGRAQGVAADSCGNAFWAANARRGSLSDDDGGGMFSYLVKLAL